MACLGGSNQMGSMLPVLTVMRCCKTWNVCRTFYAHVLENDTHNKEAVAGLMLRDILASKVTMQNNTSLCELQHVVCVIDMTFVQCHCNAATIL